MQTSDFDYFLPEELIAQAPLAERDASRLLVLDRARNVLAHRIFPEWVDYLRPGDLLVMNNSRVIPARLRGIKTETGGEVEMLLCEETDLNVWWALLRPGKRVRPGTEIVLKNLRGDPTGITATVAKKNSKGHCLLRFRCDGNVQDFLPELGEIPLPPYIHRRADPELDAERYQTVYAREKGSVAAPTAGLHFSERIFARLREKRIGVCHVTLHVGLGTFAPVKAASVTDHAMHSERYMIPAETAALIAKTRSEGGRIIAVGTTSLRALESAAARGDGEVLPGGGETRIFIYPPCRFRAADALLTNFHLPKSTLLMLVSAFAAPGALAGREIILAAYAEAVRERYRFFSYGDAMFIY